MRSLLLVALAMLTAVPTVAANATTVVAEGGGTHTFTSSSFSCTGYGEFTFTYDVDAGATLTAVVDPFGCLYFFPDMWAPGECQWVTDGLQCAYTGSYFLLRHDGSFTYSYSFASGATDYVTGTMTRFV